MSMDRQPHRIVVEGMDGAGKATGAVVQRLVAGGTGSPRRGTNPYLRSVLLLGAGLRTHPSTQDRRRYGYSERGRLVPPLHCSPDLLPTTQ